MKQKTFIEKITSLRGELEHYASIMYDNDLLRAEDAVSELFLRLWERQENLKKVESIKAYCYASLKHIVIDDLRKNKNRYVALEVESDAVDMMEQYEIGEMLSKAIFLLPELRRRIYCLHELKGYECHEIAKLLDIRIDGVHNHISRARKQLKEYILKQML